MRELPDFKSGSSIYKGGSGRHTSLHITYTPNRIKTHVYKDVLFINGCAPTVPHPPRYRVTHQREQLAANNISSDEVYYENLELELVRYYRVIVIFRCPYIDIVGEFIKKARELNSQFYMISMILLLIQNIRIQFPLLLNLIKKVKKVMTTG